MQRTLNVSAQDAFVTRLLWSLIVTVVVIMAALLPHDARAADDRFVPLQPSQTGWWQSPAMVNGGVNVLVQDNHDGRTAFVVVYYPDGQWVFGQDEPIGLGVVAGLRVPPLIAIDAGTLTLESRGCDALRLTVFDAPRLIGTLELVPTAELLARSRCYSCAAVDFSPAPPGCAVAKRRLVP